MTPLFLEAYCQPISLQIFIKINIITLGQLIQGLQTKTLGRKGVVHEHLVKQHGVSIQLLLLRLREEGDDLVLLPVDLLALGINRLGSVIHILLILVLPPYAARTEGARARLLGLGKVLHVQAEGVEGVVAGGAVEQVPRGVGLADDTWFVLCSGDCHNLEGFQTIINEILQTCFLISLVTDCFNCETFFKT